MACNDCRQVIGWRVWCDDDRVWDSAHHTWADVPDDGLLVRVIYYSDDRREIQALDYFYEAPHAASGETIYGAGTPTDEIGTRYPGAVIKRGRWAPESYFRQVMARAHAATEPPQAD